MIKKYIYWIFAFTLLGLIALGCTDATMSNYGAYGSSTDIICFSGGQKVFEDESTGYVESAHNGLQYRSKTTNRHIRLYLDCLIIAD
jgi:hypothetical protein